MQNFINRLTKSKYVPYAILVFSIASFGVLIPALGFYWDDWPMIWFGHLSGTSGYIDALAGDRPFLAGIYLITTSILGSSPISWHILALLSRWLTAFTLWWTLKKLWPESEKQVAWIALLFAIYPGFKQQPIAVIYANGFFLLTAQFLSFGLMLQAINSQRKYWWITLFGMFSLAACAFSTEYYIGLEMIRPLLIWFFLSRSDLKIKQHLIQVARHWAPYLGIIIFYLIWRVFIFAFPTYQPETLESLSASPIQSGLTLLNTVIQDIFTTGWQAWFSVFRFPSLTEFTAKSTILSWGITFAATILAIFYLIKLHTSQESPPNQEHPARWPLQAMFLGGITLLFSGAPYWVSGLPVQLRFPWDRFTLSFMLGSAIFLVGLIDWLLRTRTQKVVLIGLIIGMASGANFDTANTFRRDWLAHNDFFWQLTWRAPGLKPGTSILTHQLPLNYYSDNSLTAPLNWIYAPDNHSDDIPYYLGFTTVRLGQSIPAFEDGLPIHQTYRSASFDSTTSKALVIFYSPPGCLKIVDPQFNTHLPIYPDRLKEAFPITHPDQIMPDPAQPAVPPEHIFGAEPEHTWCYYYQKAALARQFKDWDEVVAVGNEAFEQKYYPEELTELYPFIEGYAKTGDWSRALVLIKDVKILGNPNLTQHSCNLLKRLYEEEPFSQAALQDEFDYAWFERLHCNDYYSDYQP
ncbi:MAG: hypothetical protein K8R77_06165 [Anaerolineaceae bacterium]|nr:hypothetical protein [Anaerolineaceae bacterium]